MRPFDVFGVDFFRPLPISSSGDRRMRVAIGQATRYVETGHSLKRPLRTRKHFRLKNVILHYSARRVLMSSVVRIFETVEYGSE